MKPSTGRTTPVCQCGVKTKLADENSRSEASRLQVVPSKCVAGSADNGAKDDVVIMAGGLRDDGFVVDVVERRMGSGGSCHDEDVGGSREMRKVEAEDVSSLGGTTGSKSSDDESSLGGTTSSVDSVQGVSMTSSRTSHKHEDEIQTVEAETLTDIDNGDHALGNEKEAAYLPESKGGPEDDLHVHVVASADEPRSDDLTGKQKLETTSGGRCTEEVAKNGIPIEGNINCTDSGDDPVFEHHPSPESASRVSDVRSHGHSELERDTDSTGSQSSESSRRSAKDNVYIYRTEMDNNVSEQTGLQVYGVRAPQENLNGESDHCRPETNAARDGSLDNASESEEVYQLHAGPSSEAHSLTSSNTSGEVRQLQSGPSSEAQNSQSHSLTSSNTSGQDADNPDTAPGMSVAVADQNRHPRPSDDVSKLEMPSKSSMVFSDAMDSSSVVADMTSLWDTQHSFAGESSW